MNASTERQQKPRKANRHICSARSSPSIKKRKSVTVINSSNAPKRTAPKRRIKAPNDGGVVESKSLANDEHLHRSNSNAITAHPSIVQRVQELAAQVGIDQLRKILDGLASSTSPSKTNEDWNLGSTTIKHENIHQHIKDMMNANGFS
eukprot:scaffold28585_cov79-Cyclotella_meneghiniana.AAC.1